jgi:tRNA(Glu) U13 pseudouridine synthase TruD
MDDLEDAQADFEEEIQETNDDLEEDLTANGVIADTEALGDRIESEMEAFEQNMANIRRSSKALRSKRSRRAARVQSLVMDAE